MLEKKCTWIIGDSIESLILFHASKFKYIQDPTILETYTLFDDSDNYKFIFNKESIQYENFFAKSQRKNWNSKLIVHINTKDFAKYEEKCCKLETDNKYTVNIAEKVKLFKKFIALLKEDDPDNPIYNISIDEIKEVDTLQQLHLYLLLKDVQISDTAQYFPDKKEIQNFLYHGILNDNIMTYMQYLTMKESNITKKAIMQYISARIKDGEAVWDLDKYWKNLIYES